MYLPRVLPYDIEILPVPKTMFPSRATTRADPQTVLPRDAWELICQMVGLREAMCGGCSSVNRAWRCSLVCMPGPWSSPSPIPRPSVSTRPPPGDEKHRYAQDELATLYPHLYGDGDSTFYGLRTDDAGSPSVSTGGSEEDVPDIDDEYPELVEDFVGDENTYNDYPASRQAPAGDAGNGDPGDPAHATRSLNNASSGFGVLDLPGLLTPEDDSDSDYDMPPLEDEVAWQTKHATIPVSPWWGMPLDEAFVAACRRGYLQLALRIASQPAFPQMQSHRGLVAACAGGHAEIVDWLTQALDKEYLSQCARDAIHQATCGGHVHLLSKIMGFGFASYQARYATIIFRLAIEHNRPAALVWIDDQPQLQHQEWDSDAAYVNGRWSSVVRHDQLSLAKAWLRLDPHFAGTVRTPRGVAATFSYASLASATTGTAVISWLLTDGDFRQYVAKDGNQLLRMLSSRGRGQLVKCLLIACASVRRDRLAINLAIEGALRMGHPTVAQMLMPFTPCAVPPAAFDPSCLGRLSDASPDPGDSTTSRVDTKTYPNPGHLGQLHPMRQAIRERLDSHLSARPDRPTHSARYHHEAYQEMAEPGQLRFVEAMLGTVDPHMVACHYCRHPCSPSLSLHRDEKMGNLRHPRHAIRHMMHSGHAGLSVDGLAHSTYGATGLQAGLGAERHSTRYLRGEADGFPTRVFIRDMMHTPLDEAAFREMLTAGIFKSARLVFWGPQRPVHWKVPASLYIAITRYTPKQHPPQRFRAAPSPQRFGRYADPYTRRQEERIIWQARWLVATCTQQQKRHHLFTHLWSLLPVRLTALLFYGVHMLNNAYSGDVDHHHRIRSFLVQQPEVRLLCNPLRHTGDATLVLGTGKGGATLRSQLEHIHATAIANDLLIWPLPARREWLVWAKSGRHKTLRAWLSESVQRDALAYSTKRKAQRTPKNKKINQRSMRPKKPRPAPSLSIRRQLNI